MNVVLIGPHGVGKSSLGAALAARLGVPFHGELGHELSRDPGLRPAGATAQDAQALFDDAVFRAELARDLDALASGTARVVETWHPGNLAYAERRSPAIVARYLGAIRRVVAGSPAIVVPLSAPVEVLTARKHERGELSFFLDVGAAARGWAERLDLTVLPEIRTDEMSPEQLAESVARRIAPLLGRGKEASP